MYTNEPEARATAGDISAPILPEKPAFSAAWREIAAALLLYPAAWIYTHALDGGPFWPFLLLFIALAELLCWERPRSLASWFWLGCLLLCWADTRGQVWGESAWLPMHLLAVWWVLHRSGRLLEGESGHLLPLDLLNGFFVFPFRHFFLRLRTLWYGLTHLGRTRKAENVAAGAAATAAALVLLLLAGRLLQAADTGFDRLVARAFAWLRPWDWQVDSLELVMSLPVGAYLFGLIAGSCREKREELDKKAAGAERILERLRRLPPRLWTVLTALFCLLYLLFFAVQARYLFGAFVRRLPEGFIVSEYARQGFFELCRVMAVNFALLWLVTRTAARGTRGDRALRAMCLLLLAESLLLAVVAASKLLLYIDCFGFTPRRFQSLWLVGVLALGCVCSGWSLLRGRRSLRFFLATAALSFVLLGLY